MIFARSVVLVFLAECCCLFCNAQSHKPGQFYGLLKLQPIADGVHMKVLEPYTYADYGGHAIGAAAGFVTDGASIPRALWSLVGSPFTGKYLGAAVIHDVGCIDRKYSWQVTHRMFYDAMLDSGVSEHLAKVLYYGVRLGGPRWKNLTLSAASKAELDEKIAASGPLVVTQTSGLLKDDKHSAHVVIAVSPPGLKDEQLISFEKELVDKESKGSTFSIEEIENRTAE